MSTRFKSLHEISPDIDKAFRKFYDKLLNDIHLTNFFDSQEQISLLIEKQKEFFTKSLSMSDAELELSYTKLGEYHYDIRIPYVDFMKGLEILEEHFLIYSQNISKSTDLMEDIFAYFKYIKALTAKGYLNKMLEEDEKDIELFFENLSNYDNELHKKIVFDRISWLKSLISAIKYGTPFDLEKKEQELKFWPQNINFISPGKKIFIEDLEKRISINSRNLFYFYKKGDFLEILPLYSSLLSIYKLTLLISNSLTITMTDHLIQNLKIDKLTNLYRKDSFEHFLEKEIAFFKRNKEFFSVVYIDADDFKSINDNYGHWSGDKVLEKIGKSINNNIRASDIGFRIGGDEFAIILKGANKEHTLKICENIKSEIANFEFIYNDQKSFFVDVSIGFSECNNMDEACSIKEIIKKVDKELYISKKKGKGIISF